MSALRLESEAALKQFISERRVGIRKRVDDVTLALPELDDFPVELEVMQLSRLTIENSELDRFPVALRNMHSLRRLEIDGSEIASVAEWLAELPELNALVLRRAPIARVALRAFPRLRNLVLSELPTTSLHLSDMEWLHTVEIFGVPLEELAFEAMSFLRELRVIGGGALLEVDALPERLAHCALVAQRLRAPPRALSSCPELRLLNLSKNPMTLAHAFDTRLPIEQLDLSECQLDELPEWVLDCDNLRGLFLRGNNLRSLPEDFVERLPRLEMLDLSHNAFASAPASISALNLHWLRLNDQRR